mmetsp:Transcript_226/g.209  ORF Transcript_226/g.209 Transcript_226/m.209 type:complete len:447 (-) Transcript_226:160-1500(-)|eukprot:CAMPEP_0184750144 /NCGR_PEP_ID=MMETSP0315-20130426/33725_1 /TAXON_ID=101924 /ORGANISM="Rhodosorus marinus, Strain UTEX LB 2760" /LENGTH=446 /DNA_ID=CAMNT_0027227943 /DNA_START=211 /DNA_END=1551 /DNA_ORIENTATION=-
MTVVHSCGPGVLRHPPPENMDGRVLLDGIRLGNTTRFLSLQATVLECKRNRNDPGKGALNLLHHSCVKGKRRGHVLIYNNTTGKKMLSFTVPKNEDYEVWVARLRYACDWQVKRHYALGREIGKGGFGSVVRAKSSAGEDVAVKIINVKHRAPHEMHLIFKEIELLPRIAHPNIVKVHDIFIDEEESTVSIVMELLRGGDMLDFINAYGPLSEEKARTVMRQLFAALHYLHSQGIVHRDVKPENILRRGGDKFTIALTDFGLAEEVSDGEFVIADKGIKASGGTVGYMAPEIILNQSHTYAVDLWACGVVLFILLSGKKPFWGSNEQIISKTLSVDIDFGREFKLISPEAVSLVKSLINGRPHKRLTSKTAILHRWFAPNAHRVMSPSKSPRMLWRKAQLGTIFLMTFQRRVCDFSAGSGSGSFRMDAPSPMSIIDISMRNTSEAE